MKIIFINRYFSPDHSATSQLVSDLAFELAKRGYRVRAITSRQRYDAPDAALPARESNSGVDIERVWTSRYGRSSLPGRALDYLSFYLGVTWRILRTTDAGDVVVVKTDAPLTSVVAGWAVRRRRAYLVNWLQDVFPEVAAALGIAVARGTLGRTLMKLRNRSLRLAARNIAIGDGMRRRILGMGIDADRLAVIHNWSDERHIHPRAAADNALRRQWGLKDVFVVGYSGNLGRAHEIDTVLAAAERLRREDRVVLLFIGGGTAMEQLRCEAERRQLSNLWFKPYQPYARLPLSLTVPDVHLVVLRSALEGLIVPSKVYGVLAAGRPTIHVGATEGEIPTLLSESGAGMAVAPGDGEGLAGAILRLRDDPRLRERMGRSARLLCEARFSRGAAMRQWEAQLRLAVAASQPQEGDYMGAPRPQSTPNPSFPTTSELAADGRVDSDAGIALQQADRSIT